MNVDLQKIAAIVNTVATVTSVGSAGVSQIVNALVQIGALCQARGYAVDTAALDRLLSDAEQRRLLALQEAQAQR